MLIGQRPKAANLPLLLMSLAILADGLTTVIAINYAGLAEGNPLVNTAGADGVVLSLLARAAIIIVLYFWTRRPLADWFRRVLTVALAVVTGITFAFATITTLIILIEVYG